jgi:hypothetical protein
MASRQDHIATEPPPEYASPAEERKDDPELLAGGADAKRADTGFTSFDKVADGPPAHGEAGHGDGEDDEFIRSAPAETVTDFITEVIHAEDDPSLNPWTFRTWFVGEQTCLSPVMGTNGG